MRKRRRIAYATRGSDNWQIWKDQGLNKKHKTRKLLERFRSMYPDHEFKAAK